jgi:outer membrane protein OmpA-like peptidoglycan-associated protein
MLILPIIAVPLLTSPANAQNALYLSQDASRCEIFRGLSQDIPVECERQKGRPRYQSMRNFGSTRGLVVYDNPQPVRMARASQPTGINPANKEKKDLSIAFRAEFEFDSYRLSESARNIIDRVAEVLKHDLMRSKKIQIEGHADSAGTDTYNLALSEKRAQAVRQYLATQHDIDPSRLEFVGKGERQPYDPANPSSGVNRRVEFKNVTG